MAAKPGAAGAQRRTKTTNRGVARSAAKGLREGNLSRDETRAVAASALSQRSPAAGAASKAASSDRKQRRFASHATLSGFLFGPATAPDHRVRVHFRAHEKLETLDEPMRGDISGMELSGEHLWLVNDETCSLERLTRVSEDDYGDHRSYALEAFFDLPDDNEIDLEGIALDGDMMWLAGSHSLKRKRPKPEEHGRKKTIKRLGRLARDKNRFFLARVPLEDRGDGPEPVAKTRDGRRAGVMRMRKGGNDLVEELADDPHIGASLHMPAKENGLDIEGIAARGNRVFLGLRGPVLRGMAVMIELELKHKGKSRLKMRKAFEEGKSGSERYRLHFLDLAGMGIRDMKLEDERLLLLVGPTMDLDGPVGVVSLKEPFGEMDDVTFADEIGQVIRIPHGPGTDHAEGMTLTADGDLLIAYDSPDPSRLHDEGRAKDIDLFKLP